ncbi:MAG: GNAT family N-acetyltransferase [Candidatus Paracaedibacter sp.]
MLRTKTSIEISFLELNDFEVPPILKLAMGSPTPDKIREALNAYQQPDHSLMGCQVDGKLVGILGAKMKDKMATIQHIAVLAAYRRQGIGKLLIHKLLKQFTIGFLFAETDNEAIGFYEKCGFTCKPFEGVHGKRYSCQKVQLLNAHYF